MALLKRQRKKARKAATESGEPEAVRTPESDGAEQAPPPVVPSMVDIVSPPQVPQPAPTPEPALASEQPAPQEQAAPQPIAAEQPAPPQPEVQDPAALAAEQIAAEAPSETLPVALEPELRRIIDTAVARVASIELEAIRESRKLTQRSEEEGREALRFALDRSFQLVNSFELMTVTIAGMVSALRVELDSAMAALHQVDDPYAHLTSEQKQMAEQALAGPATGPAEEAVAPEPDAQPAADAEEAPEAVTAVQGMNGDGPEIHTEPSPEITEMFREQIINMKTSGKTKEEAERTLLRFNLGRRFIGLLEEIYADDSPVVAEPAEESRGRFARRFFSRN